VPYPFSLFLQELCLCLSTQPLKRMGLLFFLITLLLFYLHTRQWEILCFFSLYTTFPCSC